jgi:polysaccharide biosynthesis/export protein
LKINHILILAVVLLSAFPLCAQTPEQIPTETKAVMEKVGENYIIGPGDILDISLWRDDAMNRQVVVLADGKIAFPLIGEVVAAGKTVAALKKEMSERLVEYVPEPVLNVEVKQSASMVIYVTGRVNSPGRFPVNNNVTVLQAISTAGGLNPFAKRNKIKIMRQEGDKTMVLPFKYDEVVDGKNLSQNIALKRGDVIVVP